jgi:hypothetical protein
MARRTYGEDRRKTVERSVEDREVIESFIEELGAEKDSENVLEPGNNPGGVEATARYRLVHPYEGGNFSEALMHGDEVTARVELYVELEESEAEVYTGHVTYDAGDIFHPRSVVEMEETEDEESEFDLEDEDIVDEDMEAGSRAAMTD